MARLERGGRGRPLPSRSLQGIIVMVNKAVRSLIQLSPFAIKIIFYDRRLIISRTVASLGISLFFSVATKL